MKRVNIMLVLSMLLSGFTKLDSNIKLNAIRSIGINPSSSHLDFGEIMIGHKEIESKNSILLTITTHEPLNIKVRSPKTIQLNNHDKGTLTFNSILKGNQGIIAEDNLFIYWETIAPSPLNIYEVEFLGRLIINGDENTGTYQGQLNLVIDYN